MPTVQSKTAVDVEADDVLTKPPFLQRVRLNGYKSIAFCDVELQPLTILVGRNASGKSNFVDALAFLRDAMSTSVTDAARLHGGSDALLHRGSLSPRMEFCIDSEFPSFTGRCHAAYSVAFRIGKHRPIAVSRERLRIKELQSNRECGFDVRNGKIKWMGLEDFGHGRYARTNGQAKRPGNQSSAREYPHLFDSFRPDRLLLGVIGSQPFIDFGDRINASGFYNFHPEAMRPLGKTDAIPHLARDGNNLARAIEGLRELDEKSIARIAAYLQVITSDVEAFKVVRIDDYETIRFRLRRDGNKKPLTFNAASMSDGTLRALAALVAAFQIRIPMEPGIVAIEEPETALHPAAMRALVDALDEATSRNQILLTTHSAELLDGRDISADQVLVVRYRNGQTQITPVDRASSDIVQKELYTLGDLQRMDRLDLDEADLKRQAHLNNGSSGA
jgi:predicted ATPase